MEPIIEKAFAQWLGELEPTAIITWGRRVTDLDDDKELDRFIKASIAVSLKRIADALEEIKRQE